MTPANLSSLLPIALFMIVILLLFWSTIIRPQARAARQHATFVQELKVGDRIITAGGIHGRITALDEKTITLEIAPNVRVVFDRRAARRQQG